MPVLEFHRYAASGPSRLGKARAFAIHIHSVWDFPEHAFVRTLSHPTPVRGHDDTRYEYCLVLRRLLTHFYALGKN